MLYGTDVFPSCKSARSFLTDNPSIGITPSSSDHVETTEVKLSIGIYSLSKPCPIDIGEYKHELQIVSCGNLAVTLTLLSSGFFEYCILRGGGVFHQAQ